VNMSSSQEALRLFEKLIEIREDDKGRFKRSMKVLRNPEANKSDGWFLYIPPCFNDALDIKQTIRKQKDKIELVWTQGATFFFNIGDTLYNTEMAYLEWSEALKHISYCIKITDASSSVPASKTVSRFPGSVSFDVYVPKNDRSQLELREHRNMTQDNFVKYLICGETQE
jgi:hypothetical protein